MNKYNYIKGILAVSFFLSPAYGTEFNTEFLKIGDNAQADLSQFKQPNSITPGTYVVDLVVNNNFLREQEIRFLPGKEQDTAVPCLPREIIEAFGLKDSYLEKLDRTAVCLTPDMLPQIGFNYKKNKGQLAITVPQIFLQYQDEHYAPPSQWDDGIPALLVDYRMVANSRNSNGQKRVNSISTFGTVGGNLGSWRLRSNYQLNKYSESNYSDSSKFSNTHAFRALPELKSQITLGQTFLASNIFDSLSFTGASIASDERMLPPSLRGYAPLITGIAKTSSKVTISQQGNTIYMTTVPAGPFSIQDLSSAVQGELGVTVEGEDGSVDQFTVNTASIPFLTRQGQIRYNVSTGKPSLTQNHVQNPYFTMGEVSYGLTSNWSIYGGSIVADNYLSFASGVGKDLNTFGAISADVTQSRAQINNKSEVGESWRLNYSKRIDSLDTDLRFFGYRFSDSHFYTLSEFSGLTNNQWQYNDKQRYTVTAAKQIGSVSTYLSYTHDSYWNAKSTQRLDLSGNMLFDFVNFKNISLNVALSYNQMPDSRNSEVTGFVGFSVPLEDNKRVNYNLQTGRGRFDQTVSVRQNRGNEDYYQITGGGQTAKPMLSGYYQKTLPQAQLGLNGSYVTDVYNSFTATANGSVVMTPKGSAVHARGSNGDTRLLVDTQGIEDIWFNRSKTKTNKLGYGVIDGIPPYDIYETRLDVTRLPENAEAQSSIKRIVLTDGAVGYLTFNMNKGNKYLAILKQPDGNFVPLGAEVNLKKSGKYIAIVGEEGLTWLTGLQAGDSVNVIWGDRRCTVTLPGLPAKGAESRQVMICQIQK